MLTDLTQGKPTKTILTFAYPILIANIFQQLYNVVDSVVVGRFIGKAALAAVGASSMLMNFCTHLIIGLCLGAASVYSQYFGAGDEEALKKAIFVSFFAIGLFTLIFSFVLVANSQELLLLINTPENILEGALSYLKVIFGGLFFVFLFNGASALFRSLGDSRTPLYFLILAALLNAGLDLFFVLKLKLGVRGVALATVIAQGTAALLSLGYAFLKLPLIRLRKKDLVFDWQIAKLVGKYSFLTSIQQAVMTFGMVCVQSLINTFGADTIAAFTAAGKIDSLAYLPVQDFGNAFSTFVAQNKGAGAYRRIEEGVKSASLTIIIFCLIFSTLIYLNSQQLMLIFVKASETEVLKIGSEYLSIISIFYVLIGFLFMFYGFFRGIGALRISLLLTIISLGTRVALAYLLAPLPAFGRKGIWWAVPIGWALADLTGLLLYRKMKKTEFAAS